MTKAFVLPLLLVGASLAPSFAEDAWDKALCGSNSAEIVAPRALKLKGTVPTWVEGIVMKNGGALFHGADRRYLHTFDAFAKLSKFHISKGSVNFQSRFVNTEVYNKTMTNKAVWPTLTCGGVDPPLPIAARLQATEHGMNDNTLIHTWEIAPGRFVATADIPTHYEFDIETLETIGQMKYEDSWKGASNPSSGAHHTAALDGSGATFSWIGVQDSILPGRSYEVHLLKQAKGSLARESVGTHKLVGTPQIHSFVATASHVVLPIMPTSMDLASAIFHVFTDGKAAMCPHVVWDAKKDMDIVAFNTTSGSKTVGKVKPFFFVHAINAFHDGRKLISDYTCYDDPTPFYDPHNAFGYVDGMAVPSNRPKVYNSEKLCRVSLDLASGAAEWRKISPIVDANWTEWFVELPRINEAHFGRAYCFVYGAGNPGRSIDEASAFNAIVKRDLCAEAGAPNAKVWQRQGHFATEPLFVPRGSPGSGEDGGVLLSIVYDAASSTSYLLVLDAKEMEVLAEAWLPEGFAIPNTYHSRFYPRSSSDDVRIVV